jgi:Ca-activated chloride channel homolog
VKAESRRPGVQAEPRRLSRALASAALALLASLPALAQTPEPPAPAPSAAAPTPALVRLGLTVVDEKNRMADDVKREDVRLFEDGVEQSIGYFERESAPVSYGLVVDNSGSLRNRIGSVIKSGHFIVGNNQPGDETFLMRFISSRDIKIWQDMTTDVAELRKALDQMYIEGGQTALIDAVYLAADYLTNKSRPAPGEPRRRRALVVLSDGEDRASYYKLDQLLTLLRESDIQVFCVGLVKDLDRGGSFRGGPGKLGKAKSLLNRLADETGGRVFFPDDDVELREASEEIIKNLRIQYVVGYAPTAAPAARPSGKLEIKLAGTGGKGKRTAVHKPARALAAQGDVKKKSD